MSEKPRSAAPDGPRPPEPASFLATAAALAAIDDAVRTAHDPAPRPPTTPDARQGPEQALAALLLLRELRTELAGWEAGLVETAREAGATWADLAHPMGVASRQAAENRYLRLKPATGRGGGTRSATGAERVKAVRDRRAADRTVTAWARDHAAELRVLAAQLTAAPSPATPNRPKPPSPPPSAPPTPPTSSHPSPPSAPTSTPASTTSPPASTRSSTTPPASATAATAAAPDRVAGEGGRRSPEPPDPVQPTGGRTSCPVNSVTCCAGCGSRPSSQEELARRPGVSERAVRRLETGTATDQRLATFNTPTGGRLRSRGAAMRCVTSRSSTTRKCRAEPGADRSPKQAARARVPSKVTVDQRFNGPGEVTAPSGAGSRTQWSSRPAATGRTDAAAARCRRSRPGGRRVPRGLRPRCHHVA